MKFDRSYAINAATTRDPVRTSLASPWFDADAAVMTASDSYILAVVPVEVEEGDASGQVPRRAIKAARKAPARYGCRVALADEAIVEGGGVRYVFPRPDVENQKAPDWPKVFNKDAREPLAVFGVNPYYLARLARALGCDGTVRLSVYGAKEAILVSNLRGDDARGAIMPVVVADGKP